MDGFGMILHKFLLKFVSRSSTVANNSPNRLYGRRIHMEAPVSVLRGFMVISTKPNSRCVAWVQTPCKLREPAVSQNACSV